MKQTFDEAVACQREMWKTIAKRTLAMGATFREVDFLCEKIEETGNYELADLYCESHLCEYIKYAKELLEKYMPNRIIVNCKLCPIMWSEDEHDEFPGCINSGSPYEAYVICGRMDGKYRDTAKLAMKIATSATRGKLPVDDFVTAVTEYRRTHDFKDIYVPVDQVVEKHRKKWVWIIDEMTKTGQPSSEIEYYTHFPEELVYSSCRFCNSVMHCGMISKINSYYALYEHLRTSPNAVCRMPDLINLAKDILAIPINEYRYKESQAKRGIKNDTIIV